MLLAVHAAMAADCSTASVLQGLGWASHAPLFAAHQIRCADLGHLTSAHLQELAVPADAAAAMLLEFEWYSRRACAAAAAAAEGSRPRPWKYDRLICNGLGDRLAVLLTVAAFAHATGSDVHAPWCEGTPTSNATATSTREDRSYPLAELRRHFHLPPNLHLVAAADPAQFAQRLRAQRLAPSPTTAHSPGADTADPDPILYDGNELPSSGAFDGVYTLAHRTMQGARGAHGTRGGRRERGGCREGHAPAPAAAAAPPVPVTVPRRAFERAYRAVAAQVRGTPTAL